MKQHKWVKKIKKLFKKKEYRPPFPSTLVFPDSWYDSWNKALLEQGWTKKELKQGWRYK